jgi:hypothetical protein
MRRSADLSFVPSLSSLDWRTSSSSSSYTNKPTRPTGSSSPSATALSSLAAAASTASSAAVLVPTTTATSSLLLLSESSSSVYTNGAASASAAAATVVFEPIMPSTETLLGMGLIVTLCIIVAYVWQTQVVPTSRTNLALSKRNGPVKEYLDELKRAGSAGAGATAGATAATEALLQSNVTVLGSTLRQQESDIRNGVVTTTKTTTDQPEQNMDLNSSSSSSSSTSRALERWLFTDWLQDNKSSAQRKPGRQKPAALPILKDAKWNSGDNPVLAATLLISVGVVLTAVTERVSQVVFDWLV